MDILIVNPPLLGRVLFYYQMDLKMIYELFGTGQINNPFVCRTILEKIKMVVLPTNRVEWIFDVRKAMMNRDYLHLELLIALFYCRRTLFSNSRFHFWHPPKMSETFKKKLLDLEMIDLVDFYSEFYIKSSLKFNANQCRRNMLSYKILKGTFGSDLDKKRMELADKNGMLKVVKELIDSVPIIESSVVIIDSL